MNFDYEKIKHQQKDSGGYWASYSDLFMALSFLFLLLYVVASFRTGTVSHESLSIQGELLADKRQLETQLKMFDRIANQYVEDEAHPEEKALYDSVISKLDLLSGESEKKQKELEENLKREKAKLDGLNNYQATIKNLIAANMNSAKDIKQREDRLAARLQELEKLDFALRKKQQELKLTGDELKNTVSLLAKSSAREKQLRTEAQQQKRKYEQEIKLREIEAKKKLEEVNLDNQSKLNAMIAQNEQKISSIRKEVEKKQGQLTKMSEELGLAKRKTEEAERTNQILLQQAKEEAVQAKEALASLKDQYQQQLAEEKQRHQSTMASLEMTTKEREEAVAAYEEKVRQVEEKYQDSLAQVGNELKQKDENLLELEKRRSVLERQNNDLQDKLASTNDQTTQLRARLADGEKEAEAMRRALAKAKEKANRRRNISQKLADRFRKSGLNVEVNPTSGDLILNFGKEYFDKNKYFLKTGMKKLLDRVIPIYATTLFEDDAIAKYIETIEVVGFASPTYKNRVVDPKSLEERDRSAINYNLDLSYKRARSIFKYIFNVDKLQFDYQAQLLPMVKVTGRSFFTQEIEGAGNSQLDTKSFCREYDCNSAQNVIIRFNLKN